VSQDLTSRIGLLEHRVESIRAALAETALRDDVRLVLTEHLTVAEDALRLARVALAVDEEEGATTSG
jgi:hypothetical protein